MARLRGGGCLAVKAALKIPAPRPAPCPRLSRATRERDGACCPPQGGAGMGCGPLTVGREGSGIGAVCDRLMIPVVARAEGGTMTGPRDRQAGTARSLQTPDRSLGNDPEEEDSLTAPEVSDTHNGLLLPAPPLRPSLGESGPGLASRCRSSPDRDAGLPCHRTRQAV